MEVTVEIHEQTFTTRVAGVSFSNADGTSRQDLLRRCRAGQPVQLVREYDNPHSKTGMTIAVFLQSGDQLGYIPSGDVRLARHIDQGGRVDAKILKITGGPGLLGRMFPTLAKKHYGCVLQITKGDPDWKVVTPWLEANRRISNMVREAELCEKSDPEKAVTLYYQITSDIRVYDAQGAQAIAWRTARYPANRLSMLLDRMGKAEDALKVIEEYDTVDDGVGLLAADEKAVSKRKKRLLKKVRA